MKSKLPQTVAIAVLTLAAAGAASAQERDEFGIASAQISLIDAITAAEKHLGGKAASAAIGRKDGNWIFEVDIVNGQEIKDVVIDPATGEVLAVEEETAD